MGPTFFLKEDLQQRLASPIRACMPPMQQNTNAAATIVTQDFLPMFAAGNNGSLSDTLPGSSRSGEHAVTSPGTAKNCMTVGATDSVASSAARGLYGGVITYDMTVAADDGTNGTSGSSGELSFKVGAVGLRTFNWVA